MAAVAWQNEAPQLGESSWAGAADAVLVAGRFLSDVNVTANVTALLTTNATGAAGTEATFADCREQRTLSACIALVPALSLESVLAILIAALISSLALCCCGMMAYRNFHQPGKGVDLPVTFDPRAEDEYDVVV